MFERVVTNAATPPMMRDKTNNDHKWQGLPFEGRIPTLKKNDPQYQQPQYKVRVHIDQFVLSLPEELTKYTEVIQKIADGVAFVSFEERVYDQEIQNWRVLIRWCDQYYAASDDEPAGMEKADE